MVAGSVAGRPWMVRARHGGPARVSHGGIGASRRAGWACGRTPSPAGVCRAADAAEAAEEAELVLMEVEEKMDKAVASVRSNLDTLRTGRASAKILDRLQVDYFGTPTPVQKLASVTTPDSSTVLINAFDATALKDIEKAINESDLGLNPSNDGKAIRLSIPQLTKDRRKELSKKASALAEDGKVALRNVRRDGNKQLDKHAKALSEDQLKGFKDSVDVLLEKQTKIVEGVLKDKQTDIETV